MRKYKISVTKEQRLDHMYKEREGQKRETDRGVFHKRERTEFGATDSL